MTKKILVLSKGYFPDIGGIETVVKDLAEAYVKEGLDTHVLALSTGSDYEIINGVKVHRVNPTITLARAPISLSYFSVFNKLAKSSDILHFNYPNPIEELTWSILSKRLDFKDKFTICTYHSDPLKPRWLLKPYMYLSEHFLKQCDTIIATSPNYVASSVILQKVEDKCKVIPLGVNINDYTPINHSVIEQIEEKLQGLPHPRLLFTGRLIYYKGIEYLLKSMCIQKQSSAVIVGKGPLKPYLLELVNKLHLENRVRFLDPLPLDLFRAIFQACDIFVLPSIYRTEAFGIVGLEALAARKPLITTELGTGTSFYNHNGTTGFVVPPKDEKAIATAIDLIWQNKEIEYYLKHNLEDDLSVFSKKNMITSYCKILREALR